MIRFILIVWAFTFAQMAHATDYETSDAYYYPQITSTENFDRVLIASPPASKSVRIGFVNTITQSQLASPKSAKYVVFAKGETAEKLIIVALDDAVFKTVYRARAILAQLTSTLRGNNFLAEQDLQEIGTFFDLLQLMHFETLVISDGETWAHKVTFTR